MSVFPFLFNVSGVKGGGGVVDSGFGGIDTSGLKDPSAPGREDFGDELNELLW